MPKAYITNAQRIEARYAARAQALADGLAAYKNRNGCSLIEMGRVLGIGHVSVARLLDGDRTIRLPMETIWRLEDLARKILEENEKAPGAVAAATRGHAKLDHTQYNTFPTVLQGGVEID